MLANFALKLGDTAFQLFPNMDQRLKGRIEAGVLPSDVDTGIAVEQLAQQVLQGLTMHRNRVHGREDLRISLYRSVASGDGMLGSLLLCFLASGRLERLLHPVDATAALSRAFVEALRDCLVVFRFLLLFSDSRTLPCVRQIDLVERGDVRVVSRLRDRVASRIDVNLVVMRHVVVASFGGPGSPPAPSLLPSFLRLGSWRVHGGVCVS